MTTLSLAPLASGLRVDDADVVRVGATRVTLDTLIGAYLDGSTAEEIVQQYPSLSLLDVHAAIAYYLAHEAEVRAYLRARQSDAEDTRKLAQQVSDQRGVRERLLARQALRNSVS